MPASVCLDKHSDYEGVCVGAQGRACECVGDENTPAEEKEKLISPPVGSRHKHGRPWSLLVLFQPVPHLEHTHAHTRPEQGLLQNSTDLCL